MLGYALRPHFVCVTHSNIFPVEQFINFVVSMAANLAPAVQWMVYQAIHCGIHEAGHKLAHKWARQSAPSNPYQELEDMILGANECMSTISRSSCCVANVDQCPLDSRTSPRMR